MTASAIDRCQDLCLLEISESQDNCLRFLVAEVVWGDGPQIKEDDPHTAIAEGRVGTRAFAIRWPNYIAYSVRNESFCVLDESEQFVGRRFRIYSASRYLGFVASATIDLSDIVGKATHWGIICLNHIIDVVAVDQPQIGEVSVPGQRT